MNEEVLQRLYESGSVHFDLPEYEQFKKDMQEEEKALRFRNSMSEYYDIPDEETFLSDIKAKEVQEVKEVKKKDDTDSVLEEDSLDGQETKEGSLEKEEVEEDSFQAADVLGDFFGGAIDAGVRQGKTVDETLGLMWSGEEASDEQVDAYLKAVQKLNQDGPSKEMIQFQKDVREAGGGMMGFISALGNTETSAPVVFETAITSLSGMLSAGLTSKEGAGAVAAGAATGAALGATTLAFAPVTSTVGGVAGAMGAAGGVLETAMSFTEFLKEEIGDKEFTPENIRAVLNDPEKLNSIRKKAVIRGGVIGMVDAISGGLAGSAAKSTAKTLAKASGVVRKGTAGAVATTIEATGGGLGEAAARAAAGQEMDAVEIGLEAVGGAPKAVISAPVGFISESRRKVYTQNGKEITRDQASFILKNLSDQELAGVDVTVKNDAPLEAILKTKKKRGQVKNNLPENISNENVEKVVDLEIEKQSLDNKNTESAKQRSKQISNEIAELSKPVQDKVDDGETIQTETTETTEQDQQTPLEDSYVVSEKTKIVFGEDGKFEGVYDTKTNEKKESKSTVRKAQSEAARQKDFTRGLTAGEVIGDDVYSGSREQLIADKSENPKEIAQAYVEETSRTDQEKVGPLFSELMGYKGKISRKSYREITGESSKDTQSRSRWFAKVKDPNAMSIDAIAQEMSEILYGTDYTQEQEASVMDGIVESIKQSNPTIPKESQVAMDLKNRFYEVTGMDPTANLLSIVAEQDPSKLEAKKTKADQKQEDIEAFKRQREAEQSLEQQPQEKKTEEKASNFLQKILKPKAYENFVKIATLIKRQFDYKKGRSPLMIRAQERAKGRFSQDTETVVNNIKELNKMLDKVPNKEKTLGHINDVLSGRVSSENSPLDTQVLELVQIMRNHIDGLSKRLLATGFVSYERYESMEGDLSRSAAENIEANLGEYLTKTYKLYETDNWKDVVPKEIVENAKNYLKGRVSVFNRALRETGFNKYKKLAGKDFTTEMLTTQEQQELQQAINDIVDKEIADILNKNPKHSINRTFMQPEGKISDKILKQRKDIPLPIQHLMGVVDNPIESYLTSIDKLSALVNGLESQKDFLKIDGLFSDKPSDEFNTQLDEATAKKFPLLKDKYMTSDTAKIFETELSQSPLWWNLFIKAGSWVKAGKTVFNPGTHIKNVLGNFGFMAINGHLSRKGLKNFTTAFNRVQKQVRGKSDADLKAQMKIYRELGLIGQSVTLGDVKKIFETDTFEDAYVKAFERQHSNAIKSKIDAQKSRFKRIIGKVGEAYQAEDDMFKIAAFEVEKDNYSNVYFDKEYSELSESERDFVDDKAVSYVKDVYPTYDRVAPLLKKIGRNPLFGNFISFIAESIRTSWNVFAKSNREKNSNVRDLSQEIYKKDFDQLNESEKNNVASVTKRVQQRGRLKLIVGGQYMAAMGAVTLGAVTNSLGLMREEDLPEEADDIRRFGPPWLKNANIFWYKGDDGKFYAFDTTTINPHSYFTDIMKAAVSGDEDMNAATRVFLASIEPFVDEDLLLAAGREAFTNKDAFGREISSPLDTPGEAFLKRVGHLADKIQPGLTSSLTRVYLKDKPVKDEIMSQFGFRPYKVDPEKSIYFLTRDEVDEMRKMKRDYKKIRKGGDVSDETYLNASEKINDRKRKLTRDFNAAMRLGIHPTVVKIQMKKAGLSSEEVSEVISGKYKYISLK